MKKCLQESFEDEFSQKEDIVTTQIKKKEKCSLLSRLGDPLIQVGDLPSLLGDPPSGAS